MTLSVPFMNSEIRGQHNLTCLLRGQESCQGSVPKAIIAFLEGNSFEEVIRLAISLGGDSDTISCMAGAIAACCYEIPQEIAEKCDGLLTKDLKTIKDDSMVLIEN